MGIHYRPVYNIKKLHGPLLMNDLNVNYLPFKAIFEHSSIGILICNADGLISNMNAFALEMFGHKEEDVIGKEIEILIPKALHRAHIKYRDDFMKNPKVKLMSRNAELKGVKKSGEEFFVEISLSFFYLNNELKVIAFINDVSNRTIAQKELAEYMDKLQEKVDERTKELSKALEKEKELSILKSRFVSMASHEFRTPLAGILSSSNIIEKYLENETIDKIPNHLEKIKTSVRNLTSILNDFLSVDRLDQGGIQARPSEFKLNVYLEKVIYEIKSMISKDRRIKLENLAGDLTCFQDQDMLKNILNNLIFNAIKYSEDDKEVMVKVEACEKNENICITVIDQGIGIPEKDQEHLFERFFRAENTTAIQGTGLGLNLAQKFAEFINGKMQFTSKENIGSEFSISFSRELK